MSCGPMNATPHAAQNTNGRSSAIDRRTTRHAGYARSQRVRKWTEEAFGWMKTNQRAGEDQIPGTRSRRMGFHLRGCGLQSGRGCPSSCWKPSHERPCRLQARRTVADRRSRYRGSYLSQPQRTDRLRRPPSRPWRTPAPSWEPGGGTLTRCGPTRASLTSRQRHTPAPSAERPAGALRTPTTPRAGLLPAAIMKVQISGIGSA
jgi:hypothetical protein